MIRITVVRLAVIIVGQFSCLFCDSSQQVEEGEENFTCG